MLADYSLILPSLKTFNMVFIHSLISKIFSYVFSDVIKKRFLKSNIIFKVLVSFKNSFYP